MQQEFLQYLKETCNCPENSRFLLTVSGGIDSIVMTWLFYKTGLDFSIAHCNFHLRGEESDEDQYFVEKLASRLKRTCYTKHIDVQSHVQKKGISVQMAARELRYAWFIDLALQHGFDFVAVAHNRNDVVETMLLNLSRGCGIRGLTGIQPRSGIIIRPLLFALRHDIDMYAEDHKLVWREDSSNAQIKYVRNRIRHEIIPEFEILNPSFLQNAFETIERLEQNEQLLDFIVAQVKKHVWKEMPDRILIDIRKLSSYPAKETLLFELCKEFGCNHLNIKSIVNAFNAIPGKQFITRTHVITKDRSHLVITKAVKPTKEEFTLSTETASIDYPLQLIFRNISRDDNFKIPAQKNFAALDADKVKYPLVLRKWTKGDRFIPLGMKGTKKISDYLIDGKVLLTDKQNVWVIESNRQIAWIVNHRIDDRFRITEKTKNILLIEYTFLLID